MILELAEKSTDLAEKATDLAEAIFLSQSENKIQDFYLLVPTDNGNVYVREDLLDDVLTDEQFEQLNILQPDLEENNVTNLGFFKANSQKKQARQERREKRKELKTRRQEARVQSKEARADRGKARADLIRARAAGTVPTFGQDLTNIFGGVAKTVGGIFGGSSSGSVPDDLSPEGGGSGGDNGSGGDKSLLVPILAGGLLLGGIVYLATRKKSKR